MASMLNLRQTLCQSSLSCLRIFTQTPLRHLKRPSCSSLFWNCSQRRPRIIVMMCVREKSKRGTPASRLRLLHPLVFLCSPVKDVLSHINHSPQHWRILKSFRDQGYCPQVCVLPQSVSVFIPSLLLPWDFTKLKTWWLLQYLRSLSITEQSFCTSPCRPSYCTLNRLLCFLFVFQETVEDFLFLKQNSKEGFGQGFKDTLSLFIYFEPIAAVNFLDILPPYL